MLHESMIMAVKRSYDRHAKGEQYENFSSAFEYHYVGV
jgi:hypothetical protein